MSLIKSSATIGSCTLASRVLGFIRDVTIASTLGASMYSDAFFVAFKMPNFLRRLFAEGAFNSAFVPQFSGMLAVEGQETAKRFASEAMSFLLAALLIVTLISILAMPWLMYVLAPGFESNPEKFDLTITLTRITMPYIIFISLVSLLGGILNSSDKFAAVAATPILMNLCLIVVPYFVESITPTGAHALAVAVFVAGIAQWLWLVWFCKKRDLLPKLVRPRLTPGVKKLLLLIGPAALGAGVAQVNLFIDLIIASQFDSGVSYLYYADRINELPLAVIGIAIGTALLPMLSKQIRSGNISAAHASQNRAIILSLFFSLPSAAALMTIAEPIIRIMFERGEFYYSDTAYTYPALIAFAAGLPAFILIKVLAPAFYANEDTKTPFKIATTCVIINLIFNLLLMGPLQHVGMALATSISGWANVLLMLIALRKRGWSIIDHNLTVNTLKIVLASAVMVLALHFATPALDGYLKARSFIKFPALVGLAGIGAATFFAAAISLNCLGVQQKIKAKIKA